MLGRCPPVDGERVDAGCGERRVQGAARRGDSPQAVAAAGRGGVEAGDGSGLPARRSRRRARADGGGRACGEDRADGGMSRGTPARFGGSGTGANSRSEEHTSELQSLMRISYAVFCLKKKTKNNTVQTEKNSKTQHTHIITTLANEQNR